MFPGDTNNVPTDMDLTDLTKLNLSVVTILVSGFYAPLYMNVPMVLCFVLCYNLYFDLTLILMGHFNTVTLSLTLSV